MSPEPTKTKTSLAVSIRTMGQDFVAVQRGQTPTPRVETVIAGPPEALPVEQLARSPRPIPQPTPIPRQTVQPTPPKPAAPSQLESVLAPKMPLPKPLITPAPPPLAAPRPPVSSILKARIQADLQEAAKRQDAMVTSVLRLLISAIHNAEISQHKETTGLNDNEVRGVIASEVQRRKEAIAGYERGGRGALTEKERTELAVLYHYLPTPPAPPAIPRLPTAPLTQPVKPAFSPPPQPPPPPAAPKPAMPPIAPPKPEPPTALQQAQPPVQKQTIPAVPARPQPATPQALAVGINRRKLILASSAIAVIVFAAAGGTLWWFKFRPAPPQPPPPIVAPTPLLSLPTQTVEVDDYTKIPSAVSGAWAATGTPGSAQIVFIKIVRPEVEKVRPHYASASQILTAYQLTIPEPITSSITDLNLFRHTQDEILSPFAEQEDRNRFGFVFKLNTSNSVTAALRTWESTIKSDLQPYLRTDRFAIRIEGPMGNATFVHRPREPFWYDNTYRGVSVRYMNIDLADQSIDYAFLPAQNLLLIAASRESMYGLIDLVLNQNSIK